MKRIFALFSVFLLAFTLVACGGGKSPEINEVKESLAVLFQDPDNVTTGFTLPTSFAYDVEGTWVSSNEDLLKIGIPANDQVAVTVYRPNASEGNKTVKLTVNLTFGKHTGTWDINLRILALADSIITGDTLGDVMIAENAGKQVVVENVALYGEHGGGFFISSTDGKVSYIHGKTGMPEAGKNYKVTATIDNYFNTLQLKDANFVEMEGTPNHVIPYELKTVAELTQLPLASPTNVYSHQTFKLKDVKIIIDGTGNYNTFLVDKDFDPTTDTRTAENSVLLYYHAQIAELRALAGLEIKEINLVIEGYRSDLFVWYFSYLLPMDQIQLKELTDAEKVGVAKNALNLPTTEFPTVGTLTLPATGNMESTITWGFKNENDPNKGLIDLATGAVTLPAEGRVKVTITATITNGNAVDTKDFDIYIGSFQLQTIEDAIALDTGLSIMVDGIITNKFANNTYGLQNATHSIAIYTTLALELGNEYTLIGQKDLYNGLHQLKEIEVVSTIASELPAVEDITALLDGDTAELYPYVGRLVLAKGLEVTAHTGADNYGNINFKVKVGENVFDVRFDSRVTGVNSDFIAGLEVGDTFDLITNLGWFKGPQFGYGPTTIAAEELDGSELFDKQPLPVVEGSTTIADFLANVEVAPAEGEPQTVTIVGTITSLAPYNSYSIEDATGAVALRVGGKNSSNIDFRVGDAVVATVKKGVFGGLVQAETVGAYTVHAGNYVRLEAVNLNEEALTVANLTKYQSRSVDLDGEVTVINIDNYGNVNLTVKKGEETILVKWDARVVMDASLLKALVVGDTVSVVGATLSWASDAPVILVDRPSQVTSDTAELVTVTFNVDGGVALSPLTVRKGTVATLPTPVKAGFAFKGWFADAEKTTAFVAGAVNADVTVYAKWEVDDSTEFTEDFEDVTLPSAYGDFNWNGLDGTTWTATHSRDQDTSGIEGKGFMLRRASDSSLTITFVNGLDALSFDYRKAYTGASPRNLEITINGTVVHTTDAFGGSSGADGTVHKVNLTDLNLSGSVTVVIKNVGETETNRQTVLDNFAWSNNN